jgi:hypothetical protein
MQIYEINKRLPILRQELARFGIRFSAPLISKNDT